MGIRVTEENVEKNRRELEEFVRAVHLLAPEDELPLPPPRTRVTNVATATLSPVFVKAEVDGVLVMAMLDTGAALSIVSRDFLSTRIPELDVMKLPHHRQAVAYGGGTVPLYGPVILRVEVGDRAVNLPFSVSSYTSHQVLLGRDWWDEVGELLVNTKAGYIVVGKGRVPLFPTPRHQRVAVNTVGVVKVPRQELRYVQVLPERPITSRGTYVLEAGNAFCEETGLIAPSACYSLVPSSTGARKDRVFWAPVWNPGQREIEVRPGTRLGELELVPTDEVCALVGEPTEQAPPTVTHYDSVEEWLVDEPVLDEHGQQKMLEGEPETVLTLKLPWGLTIEPTLSKEEKVQMAKVLWENQAVFATHEADMGHCRLVEFELDLETDVPIRDGIRRLRQAHKERIREWLQGQLALGVIRPSKSPWAFNLVVVPKKGGPDRVCIDYRRLNDITKKDAFPLPNIADMLDSFHGCKYFSTFDVKAAYNQIDIKEEDKEKTAFITEHGLYEFNRLPFGLANAPAVCQRLMEAVVGKYLWNSCLIYIDDGIVFGQTFEEMLTRTANVLRRVRESGLKLSPKKCQFGVSSVTYLGHIISAGGVQPEPVLVEKIRQFKCPETKTEIQSFLGMVNYYRRFMGSAYASMTVPLQECVTKVPFKVTAEAKEAFGRIIGAISEGDMLQPFPDYAKPFVISTDASQFGIGAALEQMDDQGRLRTINVCSRLLQASERKYSTITREALAIRYAFEKFDSVVYGHPVTVFTDHKPLVRWKKAKAFANPTMQEWWLHFLMQYDIVEIVHKPGKDNGLADGLSRMEESKTDNNRLDVQEDVRKFVDQVVAQSNYAKRYGESSSEAAQWDLAVMREAQALEIRRHKLVEEIKRRQLLKKGPKCAPEGATSRSDQDQGPDDGGAAVTALNIVAPLEEEAPEEEEGIPQPFLQPYVEPKVKDYWICRVPDITFGKGHFAEVEVPQKGKKRKVAIRIPDRSNRRRKGVLAPPQRWSEQNKAIITPLLSWQEYRKMNRRHPAEADLAVAPQVLPDRTRRLGESVEEYASELCHLACRAYPELGEQALQRRLAPIFIRGLDQNLRMQVREYYKDREFPMVVAFVSATERVANPQRWEFTHLSWKEGQTLEDYAVEVELTPMGLESWELEGVDPLMIRIHRFIRGLPLDMVMQVEAAGPRDMAEALRIAYAIREVEGQKGPESAEVTAVTTRSQAAAERGREHIEKIRDVRTAQMLMDRQLVSEEETRAVTGRAVTGRRSLKVPEGNLDERLRCPVCSETVDDEEDEDGSQWLVQCRMCNNHYHGMCAGLSENGRNGGWACVPCQKAVEAARAEEELRAEALDAVITEHDLRGGELADSLTNKWGAEALKRAQEDDLTLGPIVKRGGNQAIKGPRGVEIGRYMVTEDGVLYMVPTNVRDYAAVADAPPGKAGKGWKLCVPSTLRKDVLFAMHDDALGGGHLGRDKTFAKVYTHFYWPSLYTDIQAYVERCPECARRKGPVRAQVARLSPIPVSEVGDRWVVDLLGPLPVTQKGNKYIVVFVDSFSKYVVAKPLPTKEAAAVAEVFLFDVICEFGVPRELQSDQGKEFTAGVVQELCKLLQVKKQYSTAYRPQTNGLVERFNRTLGQMLAMYVDENHHTWDVQLPFVLFAYRSAVQASTGVTPFYLMFGREPRFPILNNFEPDPKTKYSVTQYLENREREYRNATRLVKANIYEVQRRQEILHNRRANAGPLNVGQEVLMFSPVVGKNRCRKFQWHWHGPFTVEVAHANGLNYTVSRMVNGRKQTSTVHRERLWARPMTKVANFFGDAVHEDDTYEVVEEAVYDPQQLLPTDNSVLAMPGGVKDPPRAQQEEIEVAEEVTEDTPLVAPMWWINENTGEEIAMFDGSMSWDEWTARVEMWHLCAVFRDDLTTEEVIDLLTPKYKAMANEVCAGGPLLWPEFKSQMRQRILQDGQEGIRFLLTRKIGADVEEVEKVLRDTGIQTWGTEELLRTIQDLVPRTLPANILVAELSRRVFEGIPSKPASQCCGMIGGQGSLEGEKPPTGTEPIPTPHGEGVGSDGT